MRRLRNYRRVRLFETGTPLERELIREYLRRLCLRRRLRTPQAWMLGIATASARSVLAYPRDRYWGLRMMGALGGKVSARSLNHYPVEKMRAVHMARQAARRQRQEDERLSGKPPLALPSEVFAIGLNPGFNR